MEADHTLHATPLDNDSVESEKQDDLNQQMHVSSGLDVSLNQTDAKTNSSMNRCSITDTHQCKETSPSISSESADVSISQPVINQPNAQASLISHDNDLLPEADSLSKKNDSLQPTINSKSDEKSTDKAIKKSSRSSSGEKTEKLITAHEDSASATASPGEKDTVVACTNVNTQGEKSELSTSVSTTPSAENLRNITTVSVREDKATASPSEKDTVVACTNVNTQGEKSKLSTSVSKTPSTENLRNITPVSVREDKAQLSDEDIEHVDDHVGSQILTPKSPVSVPSLVDINRSSRHEDTADAGDTDCIMSDSSVNTGKDSAPVAQTESAKSSVDGGSGAVEWPWPVGLVYNANNKKNNSDVSKANNTASRPECSKSTKETVSSCDSSSKSNAYEPHGKPRSNTNLAVEETSDFEKRDDFQPIIVSVCGGYQGENMEENNEANISSMTSNSNVNETMESFPKSAFELLRGMIHQVTQHSAEPKVTVQETASKMSRILRNKTLSSPPLLSKKTNETSSKTVPHTDCTVRISSQQSTSVQTPYETMVDSECPVTHLTQVREPVITSSRQRPQTVLPTIIRQGNIVAKAGTSHSLTSAVLSSSNASSSQGAQYSCVFVQDQSHSHQKVALLIPQSLQNQCPQTSSLTSVASESITISEGTQQQRITGERSHETTTVCVGTPSKSVDPLSIEERISNVIERALKKFQVTGADVKKSNLLSTPKLHQQEKDANEKNLSFFCSVCGERFYENIGLKAHLSRTVFLLSYRCDHCQKTFVFNNKCAFYMHIKKIKDHPAIDYDNILHLKPYDFNANIDTPISEGWKRFSKQATLGPKIIIQEHEKQQNRNSPFCFDFDQNSSGPTNVTLPSRETNSPTSIQSTKTQQTTGVSMPSTSVKNTDKQPTTHVNIINIPMENPSSSPPVQNGNTQQVSTPGTSQPDQCLEDTVHAIPTDHTTTLPLSDQDKSVGLIASENTDENGVVVSCSMCQATFKEKSQLAEHFTRAKHIRYECSQCDVDCPSICSLQAHMKIHSPPRRVRKMCCPECGDEDFSFSGILDLRSFFDHLDACKHFNRLLVIPCICGKEFPPGKFSIQHFVDEHIKVMFKCANCPIAFTEYNLLVEHAQTLHSIHRSLIEKFSQPSVVCKYCQRILKPNDVKSHIGRHILKQTYKSFFKWKCFVCSKTFDDKNKLNEHSETAHTHKPKRCTICFSLFSNRKNLVDHIVLRQCAMVTAKNLNYCVDIVKATNQEEDVDYYKLFEVDIPKGNGGSVLPRSVVRIAPRLTSSQASTMVQSKEPSQTTSLEQREHQQQQLAINVGEPPTRSKTDNSAGSVLPRSLVKIAPRLTSSQASTMVQSKEPSKTTSLEQRKHQQQQLAINVGEPPTRSKTDNSADITDKTLHQCHICQVYFIGTHNYLTHLKQHAMRGKHISRDVTRCVVCKKLILNSNVQQHLRAHQAQGVIICALCQRRDFRTMALAVKHAENLCWYKKIVGSGDLDAIEALREKHSETSRSVEAEKEDEQQMEIVDETTQEGNDETQLTVFPCHLCGLAFQNVTAREEHVSRLHEGTRMVYHCLVCKMKKKRSVFTKWELASTHISKKHRIIKKSTIEKMIKTEEQNASSGRELPVAVREKAKGNTVGPSAPKRLRISGQGDFLCGKCGFSCSASEEFSKHILSHNSSKEPQCPECGLCFTVLPALKKHLFAVHKIKNVDDYLKEKDIMEPEIEDDDWVEEMTEIQSFYRAPVPSLESRAESGAGPKKPRPSKPYECTVCYKGFDSEIDLKIHMRTHGMAFIKSKRHKAL